MDFTDKANALANKMNQLTEKFSLSEEMVISGEDIIEDVKKKTNIIDLSSSKPVIDVEIDPEFNASLVLELVNLQAMVEDFQYIRETLKETTDNGRRVLNKVTLDLLDSEEDGRAELITSFAELNSAVGKNMSLYMDSYKQISNVLVNLDKIIKNTNSTNSKNPVSSVVNNTQVNITTEQISTADLLNKIRIAKEPNKNI